MFPVVLTEVESELVLVDVVVVVDAIAVVEDSSVTREALCGVYALT